MAHISPYLPISQVGDRVECSMAGGMRQAGEVVQLLWRDEEMEQGQVCPYKVKLDEGGVTWVPQCARCDQRDVSRSPSLLPLLCRRPSTRTTASARRRRAAARRSKRQRRRRLARHWPWPSPPSPNHLPKRRQGIDGLSKTSEGGIPPIAQGRPCLLRQLPGNNCCSPSASHPTAPRRRAVRRQPCP